MAAVLPISGIVETTPFVPKRPNNTKEPFDAKDRFATPRPLDQQPKLGVDNGLPGHRHGDGALYTLEFPVTCPHCAEQITTFRVFRLLRTQVSFTSTLPRKGYVIVCPECERPISSELSGLI